MDADTRHKAHLLDEVERAISSSATSRQSDIAVQLANLFLSGSESYNEEQLALFGQVFERLIDKIETRTLVELGERFAVDPNSPSDFMQRLGTHDAAAVAAPVLSKYVDLSDDYLVDVSRTKSQAHLLAVSKRPTLAEPVTDVLAQRGDTEVARSVASNPGAKFSNFGFTTLSSRTASDPLLAEHIALRDDVPPHIFCRILVQAGETVRKRLIALALPRMHAEINSALDHVTGQLADETPGASRYDAALRRLLLKYPDGKIAEADVLELVLRNQRDDVVAGLALLSALPAATAAALLSDTRHEFVLYLCRALEFSWPTTRAVLQLSGRPPISADALIKAGEQFGRVSTSSARHALQHWQQRGPTAPRIN